ncbi:hypothetical protein BURPS1710b_1997 [Burkholderia pseudomallei 1710b]|uniref:Uncharacterized protein n=1 Tax=Burkholderia pseudomallei (strain 1710b) TaxID=320372 RepID=Q3JSR1_BURP1|nr:hypothetical protein BURPS1710b_1997 [Burkholderia pseudomallei 1710b]
MSGACRTGRRANSSDFQSTACTPASRAVIRNTCRAIWTPHEEKTQHHLVHRDCDDPRHRGWLRLPQRVSGSGDREGNRRLRLAAVRRVPASHQDDHRAARVRDADGRHRAHGRHRRRRPRRREGARLVLHRVVHLAAARPARRHAPAAGQSPEPAAARHRRRRQPEDERVHAEGLRDPSGAEVDRRGDGEQRDPADRRVLDLLRHGAVRARRRRQAPDRRDRGSRASDAEGHGRGDVVRPRRGVRGARLDDHDGRTRHPAHVREVHGQLLHRARAAVGRAHARGARVPRQAHVHADPPDSRAVPAVVRDRELGGRVPETARRARPLRRESQDFELRAADRLFVQPRRLDDVLHVRGAVHRAGIRRSPAARHADHDAVAADAHVEGHGGRAARIARRDRGDTQSVPPARSGPAADHGRRHVPRHGPFGDQCGRQFDRGRRRREVGGPARRPARRCRLRFRQRRRIARIAADHAARVARGRAGAALVRPRLSLAVRRSPGRAPLARAGSRRQARRHCRKGRPPLRARNRRGGGIARPTPAARLPPIAGVRRPPF